MIAPSTRGIAQIPAESMFNGVPSAITESPEHFAQYVDIFIQRHPKYAEKPFIHKASWRTINRPLHDRAISRHLEGSVAVGTLGPWYPRFGIIDIDDRKATEAEKIRASLGLNKNNSMRFSSESQNSWHILFRPQHNGEPVPLTRFNKSLKREAERLKIEVYPQRNRVIRLPFGRGQQLQDHTTGFLMTQVELLEEFLRLESFDIGDVAYQKDLPFKGSIGAGFTLPTEGGFLADAFELWERGLQAPSTRHHAQFKIAVLMYRRFNLTPEETIRAVWNWIQKRHNGFSKDYSKFPERVRKEIRAQVEWLYRNTNLERQYPDVVHNWHNGYIAAEDLPMILEAAGGSIPRAKFLFHLLKFAYPRRHRKYLNVHRDRFIQWGFQRSYIRYFREFEERGILHRGNSYQVGKFSKSIILNWHFKPVPAGFYIEGRSIDTFQDFARFTESPRGFRALLEAKGAERTSAYKATKAIFGSEESVKNVDTYMKDFPHILGLGHEENGWGGALCEA